MIRGGASTMYTNIVGETVTQTILNGLDEPFRTRFSKAEALDLGLNFPVYNEDVLALVRSGEAVRSFRVLDPKINASYQPVGQVRLREKRGQPANFLSTKR